MWFHDLESPDEHRRRAAEEAQRLYIKQPDLRPELEEWFYEEVDQIPPQLKDQELYDEEAEQQEQPAPQPSTVRISDEEGSQNKCIVGPYAEILPLCKGEAHHIIPDFVYRLGTRPVSAIGRRSNIDRIPGAPTLNEGMAICLLTEQHGRGREGLHGKLNSRLKSLPTPVEGTAPMVAIMSESLKQIDEIESLPPACKALAQMLTRGQVLYKTGLTAPGRTKEKPLPVGRAKEVLQRGYY